MFEEQRELIDPAGLCKAHFMVWRATRDRAHLTAAKSLLDEALARAPAEHHESMLTNVRIHREIMQAWREELDEDDGPAGGNSPTESPTRAG